MALQKCCEEITKEKTRNTENYYRNSFARHPKQFDYKLCLSIRPEAKFDKLNYKYFIRNCMVKKRLTFVRFRNAVSISM